MSRFRLFTIGLLIFFLAGSTACPQVLPLKQPKLKDLPKFNLSGTLEHIEPGRIELTTDAGYTWTLMPKRDLKVELTGKSKPAILAQGQYVEFLAKLDIKQGATVDKVIRMTIFTPDKRRMPGISPDLGFGDLEKATLKKQHHAADSPETEKQPETSKSDSPKEKGYVPGGDSPPKPEEKKTSAKVDSFVIHGRITGIDKKGKLTVQVPVNPFTKNSLLIEVADDAEITVELNDVSALLLVQKGDHVQASGEQTGETMGMAGNLRVRLNHVAGEAPPPKKSPAKTDHSSKSSDSHPTKAAAGN